MSSGVTSKWRRDMGVVWGGWGERGRVDLGWGVLASGFGKRALSRRWTWKGPGATASSYEVNEGMGMADEVKAEAGAGGTLARGPFLGIEFVRQAARKGARYSKQTNR